MVYGKELILDLYDCDATTFNRESIENWLDKLCVLIDMKQEDLHFWDYEECSAQEKEDAPDHLLGTTAIQFITTSDIRIHSLDRLRECYINIFTCKEFDVVAAIDFTTKWFGSGKYEYKTVKRGRLSNA